MALKKKYKVLSIFLIIIIIAGLFFTFCVRINKIGSGYVGVKSDIGGYVNDSASYNVQIVKGYVVYMPLFTEVYEYPTSLNTITYDQFNVLTKDGASFGIDATLSFQVNDEKVDLLYRKFRKPLDLVGSMELQNIVKSAYLGVISTYASDSLLESRSQVDSLVDARLKPQFEEMGLIYNRLTMTITIPDKLKEIVDLRAESRQNTLVMEEQLREVDFLRKIDSLRFSALTHFSIQKIFIDKWDGKLPAGVAPPIIYNDINSDNKKATDEMIKKADDAKAARQADEDAKKAAKETEKNNLVTDSISH